MPGYSSLDYAHGTVLHATSAIKCVSGVLGGATNGVPRDTLLYGIYIQLGAGPVTCTIAGLADEGGLARNWVLSGQVTIDSWYAFNDPVLNEFAAFTFTASVADKVTVFTRAFTGP